MGIGHGDLKNLFHCVVFTYVCHDSYLFAETINSPSNHKIKSTENQTNIAQSDAQNKFHDLHI